MNKGHNNELQMIYPGPKTEEDAVQASSMGA
jgi:hypothetical protein